MALGKSTSNRSLPVDATITIVNATPEAAPPSCKVKSQPDLTGNAKEEAPTAKSSKDEQKPERAKQAEPTPKSTDETTQQPYPLQQPPDSQGRWLSWLARRDGAQPLVAKPPEPNPPKEPEVAPLTTNTPDESVEAQTEAPEQGKESPANASNKRSWYQMWSSNTSAEPAKKTEPSTEPPHPRTLEPTEIAKKSTPNLDIPAPSTPKSKTASQSSSLETSPPPPLPGDASKSSGWVFWSRDKKGPPSAKPENEPHVGEIAISDTPSQAKPKRASISLKAEEKPVLKPSPPEEQLKRATTEARQAAIEQGQTPKSQKKPSRKQDASTIKAESSNAQAIAREPIQVSTPRTASPAPSKKEGPNLLLPSLDDTLSLEESPSFLTQLARLLYYTKAPELRHLSLVKDPPRIKTALAIGVHGYFPAPMFRTFLGQPTGTSIKFADKAAQCIRKWTRSKGYDCEVKSAALEGEGRIAERVELLWKLLLNWIDEIRRSDFLMLACHSQGVPVAIMLVAKLIQFGCISHSARVGICAMAGVNMGPFPEYKAPWISGSAGELFEFTDPNSKVSTDYFAAIEAVLRFGVRLTFVGSIDDQLVSLESSTFAPLTHPHIFRAVSIDSRVHAPNFLSHLVGFALKLRNVGVPDHGLIRELSAPLAGSLYSGEGHSRLYEDEKVYDLAVSFALETTTMKDVAIQRRSISNGNAGSGSSGPGTNPYILPFAMRGILEEDVVKKELQQEARELLARFDEWKPQTKALKDVKFRLEGIRSKL